MSSKTKEQKQKVDPIMLAKARLGYCLGHYSLADAGQLLGVGREAVAKIAAEDGWDSELADLQRYIRDLGARWTRYWEQASGQLDALTRVVFKRIVKGVEANEVLDVPLGEAVRLAASLLKLQTAFADGASKQNPSPTEIAHVLLSIIRRMIHDPKLVQQIENELMGIFDATLRGGEG